MSAAQLRDPHQVPEYLLELYVEQVSQGYTCLTPAVLLTILPRSYSSIFQRNKYNPFVTGSTCMIGLLLPRIPTICGCRTP